jgi:hypothetical protein
VPEFSKPTLENNWLVLLIFSPKYNGIEFKYKSDLPVDKLPEKNKLSPLVYDPNIISLFDNTFPLNSLNMLVLELLPEKKNEQLPDVCVGWTRVYQPTIVCG